MKRTITDKSVNALKATSADVTLWDNELRGFGVRCRRSGAKYYVVKYRFEGQQHWETIGQHDSPWTAGKARTEAMRILSKVKVDKKNPAKIRQENIEALTVSALCDLYLAEGCDRKKESTIATDRGRIARHIKPMLGRKKAKDVTRTDIQRFLQDVAAGKTACDVKTGLYGRAIVEGGKGTATRTVGLLGGIFSFAVDRGICETNPVHGVKRYKDHKNERYLSALEVTALGNTLSKLEKSYAISPLYCTAIRLLLLTGCRKTEILSLKWDYVDFERGYLRLPDSKTGEKVVPIGAPALQILSDLGQASEWVFPALRGTGYMVGLPKIWKRVRDEAGLKNVRIHDLRHSFASFGAAAGDSLLVIGKLLGHKDSKTTSRYAHLSDDPVKSAADRISNAIYASMKPDVQKNAEIVDFSLRKA